MITREYYCRDFFYGDAPVSAGFYMENREIKMHSHEFWELSYVYEGRGTHYFEDGSTVFVREGDFIFMSPGPAHCITSPPPEKGGWVRVCNLLMKNEYMYDLIRRLLRVRELDDYSLRNMVLNKQPICLRLRDNSRSVYDLLMTAAREYRHPLDGSNAIIENTAMSLLIYIVRLYEHSLTDKDNTDEGNDIIDDLTRIIRSGFGGDLSLEYLADYAHLSPEYLSRYFKKHTGMKLSDYITKTRIERAKYILRTSGRTINDVCEYCGYGSISSFQKAFKKYVGMTARDYRDSKRNSDRL